jgi:hypothetical protein
MVGWNTCLNQVSVLYKVSICVECVSKSVTDITNFYSKSLVYLSNGVPLVF